MSDGLSDGVQAQSDRALADLIHRLEIDGISKSGMTQAVTHRSYCAEHPGTASNERLEFLGDSILGLVVGKYIFETFSAFEEGELTKLRAAVVSSHNLSKVARSIGLGQILLLGRGEEASGGREKNSILSDTLEAVMGIVYLELGFSASQRLILSLIMPEIEAHAHGPGYSDFKSRLQELLAQISMPPPVYDVGWSGPDHARLFEAVVSVDGRILGSGTGSSKKLSEQRAAENALDFLATANGNYSDQGK
ncbi:MAG: ribonuclease III [Acidimicrobiaceae bacterium]|nr:ribonuclease III [Acidimicrobiaceae bacterium]